MRLAPRKVRLARRLLAAALLAAACAATAAAPAPPAAKVSTPEDYAGRLRAVAAPLRALGELCEQLERNESPEVWTNADAADLDIALELPDREKAAFSAAHRLLPPNERVASPGGGDIQVDNSWLYRALDAYRGVSDNDKRAAAAHGMAERLEALAARLTAQGAAGAARDKDAEKGRLNNILRRPEYDREKREEGGALQRLIESFVKWVRDLLRELLPEARPVGPVAAGGVAVWAQWLVFALCGAVLAFVAYRLYLMWGGPRLKRDKKKREARVVLGERLEADKTAADLLEEAEALARSGDLRGAIRKAYVALLCELGDRHVIRLAQNKTNRDYLRDVAAAARTRLYTEMLPLTYSFELHWYGLQDASETDWDDFRSRCRQALKQTGA